MGAIALIRHRRQQGAQVGHNRGGARIQQLIQSPALAIKLFHSPPQERFFKVAALIAAELPMEQRFNNADDMSHLVNYARIQHIQRIERGGAG